MGREAPDPVSGWALAEDRAGDPVVAERAGAGVLERPEAVPACGIPVWREAAEEGAPDRVAEVEQVAAVVPGQVAELE